MDFSVKKQIWDQKRERKEKKLLFLFFLPSFNHNFNEKNSLCSRNVIDAAIAIERIDIQ